jgi:GrpB-like predicted nucleotidyltransferase (UPF0157 family)
VTRKIEVVLHNPRWAALFEAEAQQIAAIFGSEALLIEHIGSTAIPGIKAKPIIDILVGVNNIESVDGFNQPMTALGYEPRGEFGIPGRRYFSTGTVIGGEARHVHVFQVDNPEIARHINFRDYLRAHPDDALAYSRLKESLAKKFANDAVSYTDGKSDFIRAMDRKAAAWKTND